MSCHGTCPYAVSWHAGGRGGGDRACHGGGGAVHVGFADCARGGDLEGPQQLLLLAHRQQVRGERAQGGAEYRHLLSPLAHARHDVRVLRGQ